MVVGYFCLPEQILELAGVGEIGLDPVKNPCTHTNKKILFATPTRPRPDKLLTKGIFLGQSWPGFTTHITGVFSQLGLPKLTLVGHCLSSMDEYCFVAPLASVAISCVFLLLFVR